MITEKFDLRGVIPESWACIDCGINTAPGLLNRAQTERALAADWNNQGVQQTIDEWSEVYTVKPSVWQAAGMEPKGGCLCIGCLEKRIGRTLVPKDFPRSHPLNSLPGTERLLRRRGAGEPRRELIGKVTGAKLREGVATSCDCATRFRPGEGPRARPASARKPRR